LLKIFDKPVVTQAEAEVTEKGFSNKKKHVEILGLEMLELPR
jgi:hypothetical protein